MCYVYKLLLHTLIALCYSNEGILDATGISPYIRIQENIDFSVLIWGGEGVRGYVLKDS